MTVILGIDAPERPSILQTRDLSKHQLGGTVVFIEDSDTATLDATLRAAHLVEGWAGLVRYRDNNRKRAAPWVDQGPRTADTFPRMLRDRADIEARNRLFAAQRVAPDVSGLKALEEGMARFAPDVQRAIAAVDAAARKLAAQRLADSRAEIRTQAGRYLAKLDDETFDPGRTRLRFPPGVALRSDPDGKQDVAALRSGAAELAALEDEQAKRVFNALLPVVLSPGPISLSAALPGLVGAAKTVARESVVRSQRAVAHPVLHRIDVPATREPIPDDRLVRLLTSAFAGVWAAQAVVDERNKATVISQADARHELGPAAALGARLRDRGFGDDAGPVARFNPKPVGPWAYMGVVQDTVTNLAGPGQSLVRQAVADVYRGTGAEPAATFHELAATMGALLVLHKVCPPLAIAVDVMLAGKAIWEVGSAYVLKSDAWRCTLDPARSFGVEPSVIRLALEIVGELAGVIPGGRVFTATSIVAPLSASMFQ